jgi:hypothetical protein
VSVRTLRRKIDRFFLRSGFLRCSTLIEGLDDADDAAATSVGEICPRPWIAGRCCPRSAAMSELVSEEVGKVVRLSRRTTSLSPRPNPIDSSQPLVEPVMPRLPKLRAFLWEMLQEFMEQNATPPPVAASPLMLAPEPVAARAGVPSVAHAPPTPEPTPEPWAHWLAIRARLSPFEVAVADMTLGVVKPELQAEWLAGMSVLSVDQAVDLVRSMIPEAPPESPHTANSSRSDGGSCS